MVGGRVTCGRGRKQPLRPSRSHLGSKLDGGSAVGQGFPVDQVPVPAIAGARPGGGLGG